jgi:hypothetical protein
VAVLAVLEDEDPKERKRQRQRWETFFIDSSMVPHGAAGFKCPGHLPQRHASGPDVGDGLATSLANVGRCWEVAKTCRALLLLLYVI